MTDLHLTPHSQDFPIQGTFKKSQVTLKVINDYGVEIKRTYDF